MSPADPPVAIAAVDAPLRKKPSNYPEPFASLMAGRQKRPLGDLFGLRNFGVNLTILEPGAVSALRHAHALQDEFIYVLEGEPLLVTDAGETPLGPGMCAGFPAGNGDAHHLLNRTAHRALWPVLLFFQAIGDIAWLPILLIWFGFGLVTMTFVIVYTVLFPIVLNTVLGVRSIPQDLHRAARSLGASPAQVVREVVLPGALPNIVTGLRNGLGYGWRALIAAEIIVGTSGIGFMMFDARRAGSVVEIMLGMIVLGLLWYAVDAWVLAPIERATGERWGIVQRH